MNLEPFALERWLLQPCEIDIASAGITKLTLGDVAASLDPAMLLNYGVTNGSRRIRSRIAGLYPSARADQVLVTSGTAEANFLVFFRLLEPDSELIVLTPTYMQGPGIARRIGARVTRCPLRAGDGHAPDLDSLRHLAGPSTRVILCVNPNNPTGSVITASEMKEICRIADGVGAWVVCDGALRGLELDGEPAPTPLEYTERGIATGSVSKIGITGIRIGWMVSGNRELIEQCWADKDYTTLSHPGIGEYLGEIALRRENFTRFVARAMDRIRTNLAVLAEWVDRTAAVRWVPAVAGHTALVECTLGMDSETLCTRLLDGHGVLVAPGDYFGAPGHVRVRYSGETHELQEGLRRFSAFLESAEDI